MDGLYSGAMNATLTHLLKIDMEAYPIMTDVFTSQNDELCEPAKKHRKYSPHIMKVTPEMLCNKLGISVNEIQNSAKKNCDIYVKHLASSL